MKRLIALFLTVGISQTAIAEEVNVCNEVDEMARMIMSVRQGGAPMKNVVAALSKQFANRPELESLISLTKSAYEKQRFTAKVNKANATNDFANEVYLQCLNSWGR